MVFLRNRKTFILYLQEVVRTEVGAVSEASPERPCQLRKGFWTWF